MTVSGGKTKPRTIPNLQPLVVLKEPDPHGKD